MTDYYSKNGIFEPVSSAAGDVCFANIPSSRTVTGDLHNVVLTTAENNACFLYLNATSDADLTGVAGGVVGKMLRILNVGTKTIKLKKDGSGSSGANQFLMSDDVDLKQGQGTTIIYAGGKWRSMTGKH